MKFGFFLMPCHEPGENQALTFSQDLEMVEHAEHLGYDEVWVGEHHTGGWETIPAPDIFISAAAQRTKRIRLGAGVVNLPFHHPFHVAERMAFLDQLAYGRVMMGVGPGILAGDAGLFGIQPEESRPMLRESLEIILKLYREEGPVTFEGQYWNIKDMELQVRPYQEPHLPIAVASSGQGVTAELIAGHGLDMLMGNFFGEMSGETMGQRWLGLEQLARKAGQHMDRDRWRISTHVYVAESDEEALADIKAGAERQIGGYFFNLGARFLLEEYKGQPAEEFRLEPLIDRAHWIIGDPDHCARRLRQLEEHTGGFGTLLMIVGGWASQEKWYRSMDLFARYVVPQFRGSLQGPRRAFDRLTGGG